MPQKHIPLITTFRVLDELRSTSLQHEKIKILRDNVSDEFDTVLRLVYESGPYGFTSRSLGAIDSASQPHAVTQWWPSVLSLFGRLADKDIFGLAARQHVWSLVRHAPTVDHANFLKDLLDRDLHIGVNIPTLNAARPGFIQVFRCQQSKLFDLRYVQFPVYVQKKLGGMRALAVGGRLYSKRGVPLNLPEIEQHLPTNIVLDGALWTLPGVADGVTRFFVMDVIPATEWREQKFHMSLQERVEMFNTTPPPFIPNEYVTWIRLSQANDFDALWTLYSAVLDDGYPGVMVKNPLSPYTLGRTRDWMRLVPLETMEVEVIQVLEGKGLYRGTIGAIKCDVGNGKEIKLSSGLTAEERRVWWVHGIPSKRMVIRYQEMGPSGTPKFAQFKNWVVEKNNDNDM